MVQRKWLFRVMLATCLLMVCAGTATAESSKGQLNINKAGVDELTTLPGVGSQAAAKIVEYREQVGRFRTIEDIMKVKGIGEKKYEVLKELITVK